MTAEIIAWALGARKARAAWMAKCPAHDDREPCLSICEGDDGKVLVRCHAGCDQHQVKARGIWSDTGRCQRQRAIAHGDGSAKGVACVSHARHREWTSTTCRAATFLRKICSQTVLANSLKSNGKTDADDADANQPPRSAPENGSTSGWRARL